MISLKQKFLFIHVPKAAGNSVAERLIPHCLEEGSTIGPFKNEATIFVENQFGLRRHASIYKWIRALGAKSYFEMFRFAVLRNPWDRLLAHYIFRKRWRKEYEGLELDGFDHGKFLFWLQNYAITFDELCYLQEDQIAPEQKAELSPGYHLDYYLRVETLNEDWETLCRLVDIPYEPLSHRNKGRHTSYRPYYRADTYQEIVRRCEREIKSFSYRF
jgi:hypothetical protein